MLDRIERKTKHTRRRFSKRYASKAMQTDRQQAPAGQGVGTLQLGGGIRCSCPVASLESVLLLLLLLLLLIHLLRLLMLLLLLLLILLLLLLLTNTASTLSSPSLLFCLLRRG